MRELPSALRALIDTGVVRMHTAIDVVLAGGETFALSSGDIYHAPRDVHYSAHLPKDGVGASEVGLLSNADTKKFTVANQDRVIGRTLAGSVDPLAGNTATDGALFINPAVDIESGGHWYDAKMPGVLTRGEVSEGTVEMTLTSAIDAVTVSGRAIASEFPWREPLRTAPDADPNDMPGGGLRPGGGTSPFRDDGDGPGRGFRGRYPDPGFSPLLP